MIDPDAEVQAAVADVFSAFAACGSAYGAVAAFACRKFPLRAYGGAWAGQLRWGRSPPGAGILKNPGYAGAYVFGQYASHRTVDPSGAVHTAITERPRAEWPVLIKDHHEGYITWAEYLASEARLAANHSAAGARPPRRAPRCVGDHHLRQLRQADDDQLPHRSAALLRVQFTPRPSYHPVLPDRGGSLRR